MNTILQNSLKSKGICLFLQFLSIMPIFYVNIIMLTNDTRSLFLFIIFDYFITSCVSSQTRPLNVVLEGKLAKYIRRVNFLYPPVNFVQVNDTPCF